MNKTKRKLIAYSLLLTTLLGCKNKEDVTLETIPMETSEIISYSDTNSYSETEPSSIEEKKEIPMYYSYYSFVNEDTSFYNEDMEYTKDIEKYQKVIVSEPLNFEKEQTDYAYVILDDGTFGYIEYSKLTTLPESYVEVDISDQRLVCFYNNDVMLICDVVTGNPSVGTTPGTNLGYTEINGKLRKTYLMGNAYVELFISFNSDGEGFHDASWRSEFGGDIYLNNGSHGCVNMRYSDVVELDKYTSVGTKVLIHK